jgi:hypothetical protein
VPRCGQISVRWRLGASYWLCRFRARPLRAISRFAVGEAVGKSDPGFKSSGIQGMSVDSFYCSCGNVFFGLRAATIPITSSTKGDK